MNSKIDRGSIVAKFRTGLLALALVAAGSRPVLAGGAGGCVLDLQLDYPDDITAAVPDAPVHVRLTLGAGSIQNGTTLSLKALRFFLQCNAGATRLVPCAQDGYVVAYGGDDTILTTCAGVAWSTGHDVSTRPNQVVFTPSAPVDIPAGSTNFCTLEFDVRVIGPSRDVTPAVVEQLVAAGFDRPDAVCDNGFRAATAATGGIPLAAR